MEVLHGRTRCEQARASSPGAPLRSQAHSQSCYHIVYYYKQGPLLICRRPRRENRAPNGTLTLRRTSATPHSNANAQNSAQGEATASALNAESSASQTQQYSNLGVDSVGEARFSKDKLLELFRRQQTSEDVRPDVSKLYVNNWDPANTQSTNGRGWGKSTDTRDQNYGPEVCWDTSGHMQPIGLEEMTEEEKEVSSSASVSS